MDNTSENIILLADAARKLLSTKRIGIRPDENAFPYDTPERWLLTRRIESTYAAWHSRQERKQRRAKRIENTRKVAENG